MSVPVKNMMKFVYLSTAYCNKNIIVLCKKRKPIESTVLFVLLACEIATGEYVIREQFLF